MLLIYEELLNTRQTVFLPTDFAYVDSLKEMQQMNAKIITFQ